MNIVEPFINTSAAQKSLKISYFSILNLPLFDEWSRGFLGPNEKETVKG